MNVPLQNEWLFGAWAENYNARNFVEKLQKSGIQQKFCNKIRFSMEIKTYFSQIVAGTSAGCTAELFLFIFESKNYPSVWKESIDTRRKWQIVAFSEHRPFLKMGHHWFDLKKGFTQWVSIASKTAPVGGVIMVLNFISLNPNFRLAMNYSKTNFSS